MEKSQDELMASATEARRKARRAFQKMRNSCSLTNGEQDKSKTASLSTKRSEDDWEKCHSLHIDLLDREQQLLELAVRLTAHSNHNRDFVPRFSNASIALTDTFRAS